MALSPQAREAIREIAEQLKKLTPAEQEILWDHISLMEGKPSKQRPSAHKKSGKKHTMSKSARKKIAKAQRARWAVIKKAEAEKKKAG